MMLFSTTIDAIHFVGSISTDLEGAIKRLPELEPCLISHGKAFLPVDFGGTLSGSFDPSAILSIVEKLKWFSYCNS
jgi:hypothetical protein